MSDYLPNWAHKTFNPWWGIIAGKPASRVSIAAASDEASRGVGRYERPCGFMNDAYWRQPMLWNAQADATGVRERVLCAPTVDLFGNALQIEGPRSRLLALIAATPYLDWILQTKYPSAIAGCMPPEPYSRPDELPLPPRAWIGTSAENQQQAESRIHHLLDLGDLPGRFISCSPLEGPIDIRRYLEPDQNGARIDWVMCGGGTGHGATPMNPSWAESLLRQCQEARVPFVFNGWGDWAPATADQAPVAPHKLIEVVREDGAPTQLAFRGMKAAGRVLLGQVWDQTPEFPPADISPW
jgi:protein gp37